MDDKHDPRDVALKRYALIAPLPRPAAELRLAREENRAMVQINI